MFYHASKIGWFFATPSNLLASLVLLGLAGALTRRFRRAGLGLALTAALATFALGLLPTANLLMRPLEDRFPPFRDDGQRIDGIVLLGGAVEASDSLERGQMLVNEAGERLFETLRLALRHPEARILITGGGATVFGEGAAEAPVMAAYFESLGIDPKRLIVEDRSRTTFENAVYSRRLVTPAPGERWLLVTSAAHMPRSVGVFRAAGFPVAPCPVDYRTVDSLDNLRPFGSLSDGLRRMDAAAREWAGLIGYYLSGRTAVLFPGPDDPGSSASASR